jgi:hypothetical protein
MALYLTGTTSRRSATPRNRSGGTNRVGYAADSQPNVAANWLSTAVHRSCCATDSVHVA